MLPDDFVEYSKRFEVGFLCVLGENGPDIKLVEFDVRREGVLIKDSGLKEGRACLAFASEEYVWGSENASVNGSLEKTEGGGYVLVPETAVWTIGFDIKSKGLPRRIVKRWRKGE